MPQEMSNEDVIRAVACHKCCAYRGEPCVFSRREDPEGRRSYARKSHDSRTIKARKIFDAPLKINLTL